MDPPSSPVFTRPTATFGGVLQGTIGSSTRAIPAQEADAIIEAAPKALSPQMYRAISPPTPAQSPQPHVPTLLIQSAHPSAPSPPPEPLPLPASSHSLSSQGDAGSDSFQHFQSSLMSQFAVLPPKARLELLSSIVAACDTREIAHLANIAAPRLKVDFFAVLPIEVSLYILSFIDDPQTLARASQVSRFWRSLVNDEHTWKAMCAKHRFRLLPLSRSIDGRPYSASGVGVLPEGRYDADEVNFDDDAENGTQILASLYQRYRARGLDPSNAMQELRTLHDLFLSKQEADGSDSRRRRRDTVMSDADRVFYAELQEIVSEESEARYGANSVGHSEGGDQQMSDDPEHLGWLSAGPSPPTVSPDARSSPVIVRPSQETTERSSRVPSVSNDESMDVDPSSEAGVEEHRSFALPTPYMGTESHLSVRRGLSTSTSLQPTSAAARLQTRRTAIAGHKQRRQFSYKTHFKFAYLTESNWLRGGRMLTQHTSSETGAVVTSLAMDSEWIVVGMANAKIHVFDARTGLFSKTLQGHESGVWCIGLVSRTARSISPGAEAERAEADRKWGNKGGTAVDALWSQARLANNGGDLVLSQHDGRPTASAFLPESSTSQPLSGVTSQLDFTAGHDSSLEGSADIHSGHASSSDPHTSGQTSPIAVFDEGLEAIRSWSGLLPDVDETLEWFHRARRVIELRNSRSAGNLGQRQGEQRTMDRSNSAGPSDGNRDEGSSSPGQPSPAEADTEAEMIAEREAGSLRDALMQGDATAIAATEMRLRHGQRHHSPSSVRGHKPQRDRRGVPTGKPEDEPMDDEEGDPYRAHLPGFQAQQMPRGYGDEDTSERLPDPSILGGNAAGLGNPCGSSRGYGNRDALIVSGGCDRDIRVWDLRTGKCKFVMRGHSSTVRCLKVLDGRAIAVTGSRDSTLRVWDIARGELLHVLAGHVHSVRCVEVAGTKVVSGSYDGTARVWDVVTGECLHVLRGHYNHIYAVAFDGARIATGSLDSTVRIWDAVSGKCQAILQGHTSLVGQLQLTDDILLTGGSDGRVIVFCLRTMQCLHRLCAHDHSVTCLQFDHRFIVTGGNDGRVKLWNTKTGAFIRELCEPSEAVWKITYRDDKCVILCKREGKTSMDVITFRPVEGS